MEGTRKPDAIVKNLERLHRKGIEVIVGAVTGIDTDNRHVATDAGEFDYDALVILLVAELAPDLLPGFAEAVLTPYDLEGATRTRDTIAGLMQHTTTLVITHRVSSIADVDRILVLDEGRIVEQGTPEQLMKPGTAFQELIERDQIPG